MLDAQCKEVARVVPTATAKVTDNGDASKMGGSTDQLRSLKSCDLGCKLLFWVTAQRVSKATAIFSDTAIAEITDCCTATAPTVRV